MPGPERILFGKDLFLKRYKDIGFDNMVDYPNSHWSESHERYEQRKQGFTSLGSLSKSFPLRAKAN